MFKSFDYCVFEHSQSSIIKYFCEIFYFLFLTLLIFAIIQSNLNILKLNKIIKK